MTTSSTSNALWFTDQQFVLPRAPRDLQPEDMAARHYRGVSPEHLQVYLDEFVFRHNRRRTPLAAFQTLLGLGALQQPTTLDQITGRAPNAQTESTG